MNTKVIQRRYDLNWLRVLAILAVFVHYPYNFFDTDDWLVKNATTYLPVERLEFTTSWGMPLILIISGASAFLALDKFRLGKYVKSLFLRLFLPLMVGMFTHVSFQIYREMKDRITNAKTDIPKDSPSTTLVGVNNKERNYYAI